MPASWSEMDAKSEKEKALLETLQTTQSDSQFSCTELSLIQSIAGVKGCTVIRILSKTLRRDELRKGADKHH